MDSRRGMIWQISKSLERSRCRERHAKNPEEEILGASIPSFILVRVLRTAYFLINYSVQNQLYISCLNIASHVAVKGGSTTLWKEIYHETGYM